MSEHAAGTDVEQRTITIVADIFNKEPSEIDRETAFVADLNAKSLDIIALLAALEGEFGFPISASDVRQNKTVGEAADWIEDQLEKRNGD
jgi:acyl carrier protein